MIENLPVGLYICQSSGEIDCYLNFGNLNILHISWPDTWMPDQPVAAANERVIERRRVGEGGGAPPPLAGDLLVEALV